MKKQTGVIREGLRLSHGVTTRLPRVAPMESLRYKNWVIPPGVCYTSIAPFTAKGFA